MNNYVSHSLNTCNAIGEIPILNFKKLINFAIIHSFYLKIVILYNTTKYFGVFLICYISKVYRSTKNLKINIENAFGKGTIFHISTF